MCSSGIFYFPSQQTFSFSFLSFVPWKWCAISIGILYTVHAAPRPSSFFSFGMAALLKLAIIGVVAAFNVVAIAADDAAVEISGLNKVRTRV